MNVETLIVIYILILAVVGWYLYLLEEYERQLHTTDSKAIAVMKAMSEQIFKDVGLKVVKFLLFTPIVLFVIGGVIGLLVGGWGELIGVLN